MFELVYTSAPNGLKEGSHGFCSVAWTVGMPANLIGPLEQFSGYKPVFQPNSPHAEQNPVSCSFIIAAIGGRQRELLSRIAYAGLDYSGRTNKIAHQILPEAMERVAGGPVAIFLNKDNFFPEWKKGPEVLPMRNPVPAPVPFGVAAAWSRATGDAGWAGAIAEWFKRKREHAHVIFRVGTELLPLVAEISALLSTTERWQFTFNTYFIAPTPGAGCFLRFCVDGTEAATKAKRLPGSLVIDLANPTPVPTELNDSPFVLAARSGEFPPVATATVATSDEAFDDGGTAEEYDLETTADEAKPGWMADDRAVETRLATREFSGLRISGCSSGEFSGQEAVVPVSRSGESAVPEKNSRKTVVVAAVILMILAISSYFIFFQSKARQGNAAENNFVPDDESIVMSATEPARSDEHKDAPGYHAADKSPPPQKSGDENATSKSSAESSPDGYTPPPPQPSPSPAKADEKPDAKEPTAKEPDAEEPTLAEKIEFFLNWKEKKSTQDPWKILPSRTGKPLWIKFSSIGNIYTKDLPLNSYMEITENGIDIYAVKDKKRYAAIPPIIRLYIEADAVKLSVSPVDVNKHSEAKIPHTSKIVEIIAGGKRFTIKTATDKEWESLIAAVNREEPADKLAGKVKIEKEQLVLVVDQLRPSESVLYKLGKVVFGAADFSLEKRDDVSLRFVCAIKDHPKTKELFALLEKYNGAIKEAEARHKEAKEPGKRKAIKKDTEPAWKALAGAAKLAVSGTENPCKELAFEELDKLSGNKITSDINKNIVREIK